MRVRAPSLARSPALFAPPFSLHRARRVGDDEIASQCESRFCARCIALAATRSPQRAASTACLAVNASPPRCCASSLPLTFAALPPTHPSPCSIHACHMTAASAAADLTQHNRADAARERARAHLCSLALARSLACSPRPAAPLRARAPCEEQHHANSDAREGARRRTFFLKRYTEDTRRGAAGGSGGVMSWEQSFGLACLPPPHASSPRSLPRSLRSGSLRRRSLRARSLRARSLRGRRLRACRRQARRLRARRLRSGSLWA